MRQLLLSLFFLPLFAHAQIISTVAGSGTGTMPGDGGPATAGVIGNAQYITFDKAGNLYISDVQHNVIRKVSTSGIISTVAGTGTAGNSGDGGPATAAQLNAPLGITCDTAGNLFICDRYNYSVRKVNRTTGIMTTIAGTGTNTFTGAGDGGPATAANFNTPCDVLFDQKGNLYIADNSASVIRRVTPAGIISRFAGIAGSIGYSGDGGPATAAQLHDPIDLAIDDTGNIYSADQLGRRIRKIDVSGIMHTVAGTGTFAYNGDSIAATSANFVPDGIAWFNDRLYIATGDHRIRMVNLLNDTIYNLAGTGLPGFNGDGILADTAVLYNTQGIATHECGSVYFADAGNFRIRKITYPPAYKHPTITITSGASVATGLPVTVTATVSNAGSHYAIRWMNHGIQFATTTVPSVTYTKPAGIDTITARVVSTVPDSCYDSTSSLALTVNVRVGVNSVHESSGCMIYPNPAHDVLNITGIAINSVDIFDMLGHTFYNRSCDTQVLQMNIADLPAGIYVIKINGTQVSRLIKE